MPFNLRLISELVNHGVSVEALAPAHAQINLLDRYFQVRLRNDDNDAGDVREELVRRIAESMVQSRGLRTPRSTISDPTLRAILNDVLSRRVLVEWAASEDATPDRQILAFAHNVFFDYAVERLVLPTQTDEVLELLVSQLDLSLALRPSLSMRFERRWNEDSARSVFWAEGLAWARHTDVPEISKTISAEVAARRATSPNDFDGLFGDAENASPEQLSIIRHIVGSVLTTGYSGGTEPWSTFAERIARLEPRSALFLIEVLVQDSPSEGALGQLGEAARCILETATSQEERDRSTVGRAIRAVVNTIRSNVDATINLLRTLIHPETLRVHGHGDLFWLGDMVRPLLSQDADFVVDLYSAAFKQPDETQDTTVMSRSQIIGMTSTRAQDYRSGLFQLAQHFPAFLQADPVRATRALVSVLDSYVRSEHPLQEPEDNQAFLFRGVSARIRRDYSAIWDGSGTHDHDEAITMLRALGRWLGDNASNPEQTSPVLELIAQTNESACLWRALLKVSAQSGDELARQLVPLAKSPEILGSFDTNYYAGEYLRSVFPTLEETDREAIESAVLSLGDSDEEDSLRSTLLGSIEASALVTEAAKDLVAQLAEQGPPPKNRPPFQITSTYAALRDDDFLGLAGVDPERPGNAKVRDLARPVSEFSERFRNAAMSAAEANAALPELRNLSDAVRSADLEADAPAVERAKGYLAEAARLIVEQTEREAVADAHEQAQHILTSIAKEPLEPPTQEEIEQFDRLPSWGRPSAPIDAALGLLKIAETPDRLPEVEKHIVELAASPWPSVRFQIVAGVVDTYRANAQLTWRILEPSAQEETSTGVLQGTLSAIARLAPVDAARVAALVTAVLNRVTGEGEGPDKVRELAIGLLVDLHVWRSLESAEEQVRGIVERLGSAPEPGRPIVFRLKEPLIYENQTNEGRAAGVRSRAAALLASVVDNTAPALKALIDSGADDPGSVELGQSLVGVVDGVALHLSGLLAPKRRGNRPGVPEPIRRELYGRLVTILDALESVAVPQVAHYLVELLVTWIIDYLHNTWITLHC